MPLYKLFGGKRQENVPLCYCSWHDTPENQKVSVRYKVLILSKRKREICRPKCGWQPKSKKKHPYNKKTSQSQANSPLANKYHDAIGGGSSPTVSWNRQTRLKALLSCKQPLARVEVLAWLSPIAIT